MSLDARPVGRRDADRAAIHGFSRSDEIHAGTEARAADFVVMIRNADGEHALERGNVRARSAIVDAVVGHAEHDQRAAAVPAVARRGVDCVAHRIVGRRRRARIAPTVGDDSRTLFDRPAKRSGGT